MGKMGEEGQKVQISSYNLNHGDVMCTIATVVNNIVFHI